MPEYVGSMLGASNSVTREYPVASGVTVTDGDFVRLDAAGRVSSATIGTGRLLGVVMGGPSNKLVSLTNVSIATGDAGGTVSVLVNIEVDCRYLIKCDNITNTLREASQGRYYNLIGATGAQLVSGVSESTTVGQLICVQFNPGIRGTDATYGLFAVAQEQISLG